MATRIKLQKEKRDRLIQEIKTYFLNERDEELGDLAAGFLLDFFLEKLAPDIYDQGIYDAYRFIGEKLEDMLEFRLG